MGLRQRGNEQRKDMTLTHGLDVSARGESAGSYSRLRWARPRGERGSCATGPVQERGVGEGRLSRAAHERERGGWATEENRPTGQAGQK